MVSQVSSRFEWWSVTADPPRHRQLAWLSGREVAHDQRVKLLLQGARRRDLDRDSRFLVSLVRDSLLQHLRRNRLLEDDLYSTGCVWAYTAPVTPWVCILGY